MSVQDVTGTHTLYQMDVCYLSPKPERLAPILNFLKPLSFLVYVVFFSGVCIGLATLYLIRAGKLNAVRIYSLTT